MFTTHRGRGSVDGNDDIVTSINDVRNGLFVNAIIHRLLGQSVAFLKVSLVDLVLGLVNN